QLNEAIFTLLPFMLALCFIAFSLSLKSSIEEVLLYLTARQASGEISAEEAEQPFRPDVEAGRRGPWLSFKTYAPACAFLLLMGALQFKKLDMMIVSIKHREIYTVKALQAAGVPLPFWLLASNPHTRFRLWLRKVILPFGRQSPDIIQSYAMMKFL